MPKLRVMNGLSWNRVYSVSEGEDPVGILGRRGATSCEPALETLLARLL